MNVAVPKSPVSFSVSVEPGLSVPMPTLTVPPSLRKLKVPAHVV